MRPSKGFSVRIFLYSAVALYLGADLFLLHGPLKRRLQRGMPDSPESIAAAKASGVVARVMQYPILASQLERATKERLWLRGKSLEELPPAQRKIERFAALDDLIDQQLLRVKTKANAMELPVSEAEIDAALGLLKARYASDEAFQADLLAEGIDTERELRLRIGGRLQQEKYVESRISPLVEVSEEEAREWLAAHAEELARPERVEVRHIYLSTLKRDATEARDALQAALEEITGGKKDFPALAAELSEDPRSKERGGTLGWLTKDRLPADFATPVFSLEPGKPTLIRTKLGWHLVEVTARKAAEPREYEEAKEEIVNAITTVKRREAAKEFRRALRAREGKFIEVFTDVITE